jgi:hypothetical protein
VTASEVNSHRSRGQQISHRNGWACHCAQDAPGEDKSSRFETKLKNDKAKQSVKTEI